MAKLAPARCPECGRRVPAGALAQIGEFRACRECMIDHCNCAIGMATDMGIIDFASELLLQELGGVRDPWLPGWWDPDLPGLVPVR